ncbi:hypothetical protein [Allorhizocola rhizosphaerae]|uniref:hypothetical protein n=1 Tax=Allorhizocola rhizosphaerae TaxID=1872709 RepID=UPI000E3DE9D7|nr:hypothetical protein [Allorhizocola rhizosphaerae]
MAFGLIGPRRRGRPAWSWSAGVVVVGRRGRPAPPWSARRDPSFVDLPLAGIAVPLGMGVWRANGNQAVSALAPALAEHRLRGPATQRR